MARKILALCITPMLLCRPAFGSEPTYSGKTIIQDKPTVEEIIIKVHPVFDESNPDENKFLFRLVNRLHINTKQQVIEKDLTFKKGDSLDLHLLEESERRLRERRYFANAKVRANINNEEQQAPSRQVQVDVQEVWTLIPKISYSNTGGKSHFGYGLQDSNFLGLGKTVKIEQDSSQERTSSMVVYRDPNFLSDKQLALSYSDNSDGKNQEFHLSNPFRSSRTPWTTGIDLQDFKREDTLFNGGNEAWRFGHDGTYYSMFYGQRLSSSTNDRTYRWQIGWDGVTDDFYSAPQPDDNLTNVEPTTRNYKIAWLEYSYLHFA